MSKKQEPNFHPISAFAMINSVIDQMLENTEEQYETLLKVKDRPYSLNNEIVNRIFKLYKEQLELLKPYEIQSKKWKELSLSKEQEENIKKYDYKISEIKEMSIEILEFAEKFKDFTIERLLEKDEFEIGLEWLLKNTK